MKITPQTLVSRQVSFALPCNSLLLSAALLSSSGCASEDSSNSEASASGGSPGMTTQGGGATSTRSQTSVVGNGLAGGANLGGRDSTGGTPSVGGTGSVAIGGSSSAGGSSLGESSGGTSSMGGSTGIAPHGTFNLFVTLLGKSESEVDAKVATAVNRYFGIGTNEPATPTATSGYRCFYELPQDPSMGFIWAADSNDIRSEGMSYGMMIAVQMDMKVQFDKLWKFAKTYMQYPSSTTTTAWKHYFRWQGTVNTSSAASWTVSFGTNTVPAPDGDEYFAAALYLADKRWGSSAGSNYKQDADDITTAMLHNGATSDARHSLINTTSNMVVFVPYGDSYGFTDPSYHLPAFYELFAAYGPAADGAKWKSIAQESRGYFVASAHPTTGLHPDYAAFSGTPVTSSAGDGHDQFRYDAWRVPMNMAVDYVWFSQDPRLKSQIEKYHDFFSGYLGSGNVTQSLFALDGSNATGGGSTALTATLASGSLASGAANRDTFVRNLWDVAQQSGKYRYYQEGVYLLGLLTVAGKYNYSWVE
ncbi:MAG: glycosyl hydrolase family 8 [Polyangiaceae bacterium]